MEILFFLLLSTATWFPNVSVIAFTRPIELIEGNLRSASPTRQTKHCIYSPLYHSDTNKYKIYSKLEKRRST